MLAAERRASIGLALIFALRMLGLFLVMPVLPLEAPHYLASSAWWRDPNTGHASAAAMGAAMGIYGLTQASLQLPWGSASDYWGRKRVIAMGLLLALTIYALLVAKASAWIGQWPVLAQTLAYVVLGTIWLLPLRRFLIWMETGRFSPPE